MPDWLVTTTASSRARLSRPIASAAPGSRRTRSGSPQITDVLDDGAVAVEEDGARPRGSLARAASASAAATAASLPRASVRGSSSTRPPATRATTDGIAQPEPERQAVGAERAGSSATSGRRQARRSGNAPPPTADSPAVVAGAQLGGTGGGEHARRPARERGRDPASACGAPESRAPPSRDLGTARAWPRARRGSACPPGAPAPGDCARHRATSVVPGPRGSPPEARRAACHR